MLFRSDSPDLPKSIINESFGLLLSKQAEVVLGPCHDGGYYLVGLRKPYPELFRNIPWSTKNVRSEERRVGKECSSRWSPYHEKKKKKRSVTELS